VKTLSTIFTLMLGGAAEAHPAPAGHAHLSDPVLQLHPLIVIIGVVVVWRVGALIVESVAARHRLPSA
jgi:hypothetical protein